MQENGSASLAKTLAALAASEMLDALGARNAPRVLRWLLGLPLGAASHPLGRVLADFDRESEALGLPRAAARTLERLGATLGTSGRCPASGPLLILANHPGAYDALALMAALGREDLAILAAERDFLRALPRVSRHLLFVPEATARRACALRRALAHVAKGGALLHFPAGDIEPDPDFEAPGATMLGEWTASLARLVRALARAGGQVLPAGVRGVHSRRIKQWSVSRAAERRGITTLAPLFQVILRARDVNARVSLGAPLAARDLSALTSSALHAELRQALAATLTEPPPRRAATVLAPA